MSAKPKSKTGGLDDQQIQATVSLVKLYWPDYPISPSDIRKPSREFVLNFYTNCVKNLDDKCTFVIRSNLIPDPPGLSEEELLYVKLSKIPTLVDADFKLGDLFTFDPKRVNKHIYVTAHFMIFTDSVMDKMVQTCNRVFDTNDKMAQDEEELKKLKEEKIQKEVKMTLAKAENKKLKEITAQLAPKYQEVVTLAENLEKNCKDFMLELEKLKSKAAIQQEDIQKLQKTELELQKQVVTEEEYIRLKSNLESLIKQEENLQEIDEYNGLSREKKDIGHLQRCLSDLNCLNLSEELFEVPELRVHFKNKEETLKYSLGVKQRTKADITQLKTQLENQKQELQKENQKLQKTSKQLVKNFDIEETNIKKKYQNTIEANSNKIEELTKNLEQIEADCKRLKDGLLKGYNSICKIPEMAMGRFEEFLKKLRTNLKGRS